MMVSNCHFLVMSEMSKLWESGSYGLFIHSKHSVNLLSSKTQPES